MNINVVNKRVLQQFGKWLCLRISEMYLYDIPFWRTANVGLWLVCSGVLVIVSLGIPTGFGSGFDASVMVLLGTAGLGVSGVVIAFLLALIRVPVPRFHMGSLLYVGFVTYIVLYYANIGVLIPIVLSIAVTIAAEILGLLIAVLLSRCVSTAVKLLIVSFAAVLIVAAVIYPIINNTTASSVSDDDTGDEAADVQLVNPAQPGSYKYTYFTYGSGQDKHREEFAGDVGLVSRSVDASKYITKWNRLRSWFWHFDQKALPINGRVWIPEGTGPFPLVLMVHGNHLMEQLSDEGYGYLGELLASRGFIAVSVDENFLNYSVWSNIPNQDMKVRAWLLLKHLQQIASFNDQPGNLLSERVDLSNVALIGHSRGGQAAAMAADRARWFKSDISLTDLEVVHIQAVVGIAPTDTTVDHQSAKLHNTYYLTLQGAQDGDVNNFYGDEQYIRSNYDDDSDSFKASVYIGEANHSQFNTEWGALDLSLPEGLFLSRKAMMDADEQREVAKVYVSAFVETALHHNQDYAPLFRNFRYGQRWLPDATYVSRFENGHFLELARFDEDRNKTTMLDGVTAEAADLSWDEQDALNRERKSKDTRGVALEWKEKGTYTLNISDRIRQEVKGRRVESLQFSMANLVSTKVQSGTEVTADMQPNVEIELESMNGVQVKLPLSSFMPIPILQPTMFTNISWLEKQMKKGKYKDAIEPVFQTYPLSLAVFQEENPNFDAAGLKRITFYFVGGRGKVMLDDIGLELR